MYSIWRFIYNSEIVFQTTFCSIIVCYLKGFHHLFISCCTDTIKYVWPPWCAYSTDTVPVWHFSVKLIVDIMVDSFTLTRHIREQCVLWASVERSRKTWNHVIFNPLVSTAVNWLILLSYCLTWCSNTTVKLEKTFVWREAFVFIIILQYSIFFPLSNFVLLPTSDRFKEWMHWFHTHELIYLLQGG